MSRAPSKRRAKRRAKRQRIVVDFETRSHHHMGDSHFGCNEQVMAYAVMGGLTEFMVMTGGDFIYPREPRK